MGSAAKMWKAPARRDWSPKPMDPGQVVVWWRQVPGRWEIRPRIEDGQHVPGQGWTDGYCDERIGVIWSEGSAANTWWVLPDDDMLNPVIVRRAGKKQRFEYPEGDLFESGECSGWREQVRRAENVRARGIFAVIEHTEPGRYDYTNRKPGPGRHTVVWHCDQDCPGAAGKERYDGEGDARNYRHGSGYAVWTAYDVACALMGLEQVGCSPTPFCARCVMLAPELASVHSCASVSA